MKRFTALLGRYKLVAALVAVALFVGFMGWISGSTPAEAATLCKAPTAPSAQVINPANVLEWKPGKVIADDAAGIAYNTEPLHDGRDLVILVKASAGPVYNQFVYQDAKGVCKAGKLATKYQTHVHYPGISPKLLLTKVVVTLRPGWTPVGIEIISLPIPPKTKEYSEWIADGDRITTVRTGAAIGDPKAHITASEIIIWLQWDVNAARNVKLVLLTNSNGQARKTTIEINGKHDSIDYMLQGDLIIAAMLVPTS